MNYRAVACFALSMICASASVIWFKDGLAHLQTDSLVWEKAQQNGHVTEAEVTGERAKSGA
jgi:hypothetical protein